MLSIQDLMYNTKNIQPLGSRKGVLNKPTCVKIDIKDLFLSPGNISNISLNTHTIYRQYGGKTGLKKFKQLIILLMKKFAKENDLYGYETVENQTMRIYNYPMILKTINKDFVDFAHKYFGWDNYNPFRDLVEVGTSDNRVLKKSSDLTPDDHLTLEVWREQFTQVLGRNFRDNNKIPVYRTSLQTRHYDRSNEGLKHGDSDRASLDMPIYGYDMSQIHRGIDNYKSEEWYGI
jgi:hypothetical protein